MNPFLRCVSTILVLSCLLAPLHWVSAQGDLPESPLKDQTWVRLGGPPGGVGYDIRLNPDNPNNMIVTDAMAGFHISADRGQTWYVSNTGIDIKSGLTGDLIPVFSVRFDPNNPDNIWLGLQDLGGIFYSQDGGETWERRMDGIEETYGISFRGFAILPGNSDVVFAAAEVSSDWWAGEWVSGGGYQLVKGVIYKTTDRGLSWKAVWRGDNLARYILIDPSNSNVLYASTGIFDREAANSDWNTQDPGGVGMLKSTDGGETWFQINNGLGNLYINSIDFHPLDSRIILAGTRHANPVYNQGAGIYLTHDGGENWQYMGGSDATAVEFADQDPKYAYAIGQNEFFRSTDGAETWEQVNYPGAGSWGHPRIVSGFAMDIIVDPDDPLTLYVNAYQGGNYISYDGGDSWSTASRGYAGSTILKASVYENNPAYVFVTGRTGPFLSINGGIDWMPVGKQGFYPEGSAVAIAPDSPNHLLSADLVFGCILTSDDFGNSWSTAICHDQELTEAGNQGLDPSFTAQGPPVLIFAPSDPMIVYAGFGVANCQESLIMGCDIAPIKLLLVSTDSGISWSTVDVPILENHSVNTIVVHPKNADILWIATSGDGILKSEDGGNSWLNLSKDLKGAQLTALAIDYQNPDILYTAIMRDTVYKSEDGGLSWLSSGFGMNPNETIRDLEVDRSRPNVIYAGTDSSGVYLSEDYGSSWTLINQGLSNRSVLDLSLSSDGSTLYAVTQGGGTFRLSSLTQVELDNLGSVIELPDVSAVQSGEASSGENDQSSAGELNQQAEQHSALVLTLPEWSDSYLIDTDPVGDLEREGLDFTKIYAAKDDNYLYFEVEFVDPSAEVVQFDILLTINGVETMINHTATETKAYINDPDLSGPDGSLANALFILGETYQVQIALDSLGNPEQVRLRSVGAAVGSGGADWGVTDSWYTDKDTPYYEWPAEGQAQEEAQSALDEADREQQGSAEVPIVPLLAGGGVLVLLGASWYLLRKRQAGR